MRSRFDGGEEAPVTGETEVPVIDLPEPVLPFGVVGIGGSAGGLEAISTLLHELPTDTGMAFVYVSHLAPNVPSHLAAILGRATSMPCVQVEDEPALDPDHVYIIPPNRSMVLSGGKLHLHPREDCYTAHRPIDDFLRSLATDQGRRAIGVILSGLGDDGTLGLEEIKAAGGFAFAQDESAQYDSMPRSAIAAGCVDVVLPPEEIARELARMARHPYVAVPALEPEPSTRQPIGEVLKVLHDVLGADFSAYKRSTLYRRISRRMVLHKIDQVTRYAELIRKNPAEIDALFQDILINVTSFFRDPEAFQAIKTNVLPELTADRSRHDPLRIWVLGCSTGEEAYSLAMLCQEHARESGRNFQVQIFATDLNAAGIEKARGGIYTKVIEQSVSPARLRQFFVQVDGAYRVSKSIREMCVFARHNGLSEPPFSRMDLVSCRNMLIYLDRSLQQRLVPTLHYSLKPDGYMWLGSSEAATGFEDLFALEDSKFKIYRKKGTSPRTSVPITLPSASLIPVSTPAQSPRVPAVQGGDLQKEADRLLLARYAPVGVLVNANLDILHFRGDTSAFLMPAPGKASLNLLKMAREGLMVAVRAALSRAQREGVPARQEGLMLSGESGSREVEIEVIPLRDSATHETNFLVLFDEPRTAARQATVPTAPALPASTEAGALQAEIERLVQELAATREYLQSIIEQQEAANEELQSANEEIESTNEELQSINEELESSKEEIQSSNEELSTVNDELHNRNLELTQANDDLLNLFASVRMPIVMLGSDLCIRRFTPMAEKLLNLRGADIGRSIGDIKLKLSIDDIEPVIAEVIDTVTVRELDVKDRNGRWYSLRIWPYRTLENKIDGAVLLLVDIDSLKRARGYAEAVVAAVAEPLLVLDADLRVQKASDVFYRDFGVARDGVELALFQEICDGRWNVPELRRALDTVRYLDERIIDLEFTCKGDADQPQTMLLNAQRLAQDDGSVSVVLTIKDIADRKRLEASLRSRVEELADAHRRQTEFLGMLAHELRDPLAALLSGSQLLESVTHDPPLAARTRAMMERQVAHMARMIDDLLDVSRMTGGHVQLRMEAVDLALVTQRVCDAMSPLLQGRGQQLQCSATGPLWVDADAIRLEQVLGNLLSNASKFTPEGGNVWVTLERCSDGNVGELAVLQVRDDGIGLAQDMLTHVFKPFVQVKRSTGAGSGLGIGLTLVRQLVELHGGTVEASSDGPGHGCCFEVRLPLRREQTPPQQRGQAPHAEPSQLARVLVVDDNPDAAESLAVLLRLSGHDVRTAHDGASALQVAADFVPDAVLLDIGMPDMDGYETARRLRRLPGLTRMTLIALSGYGQPEDRERSRDAGFDEHLMKPVNLVDIEAALAAVSPRRRPGT